MVRQFPCICKVQAPAAPAAGAGLVSYPTPAAARTESTPPRSPEPRAAGAGGRGDPLEEA